MRKALQTGGELDGGANARRQHAAAGPVAARLARSSGGARPPAGGQARHRSSLRAGGHCQASRRVARNAVSAPGRARDPGGLRPRLRPRLDGRGNGRRAGRGAGALSGGCAQSDPVARDGIGAGAGGRPSPGRSRASASTADSQRARQRPLYHGRPDDHPQSAHGQAERLDPSLPIERAQPPRRAASSAPCPHVLRDGGAGRERARSRHRRRSRPAHIAGLPGHRSDRCRRAGDRRRAAPAAAVGGQVPDQRIAGTGRRGDRDRGPFSARRARSRKGRSASFRNITASAPSGM